MIALELKKKSKLARIERDIVKRLVQGLVMEVLDRSVEQADYMEDIGLVDIVHQAEVLLALRNLWIVDDMELVIDASEMGGFGHKMLDLTTDLTDEASQIRSKLFPNNKIDLTGVLTVQVRGDGHCLGVGGEVDGLRQDLHC